MVPPIPLSSWTAQSPPGATQSAFVLQNSLQVLTVADASMQSVPSAHSSADVPHAPPTGTFPAGAHTVAVPWIVHSSPAAQPHCGIVSWQGLSGQVLPDELLDDEVVVLLDEVVVLLDEVVVLLLDEVVVLLLDEVVVLLLDDVAEDDVVDDPPVPTDPPVPLDDVVVETLPPPPVLLVDVLPAPAPPVLLDAGLVVPAPGPPPPAPVKVLPVAHETEAITSAPNVGHRCRFMTRVSSWRGSQHTALDSTAFFERGDRGPRLVGHPHLLERRVADQHDHARAARGGLVRRVHALDAVLHAQAAVADLAHPRAHAHRRGEGDRPEVVAGHAREDGPDLPPDAHARRRADALDVGDPRGLEPGEVPRVVDVPERVQVTPLHGDLQRQGEAAHRHVSSIAARYASWSSCMRR
jgi:hypothetical protein